MTAIEAMTKELKRVQQAQVECMDENGLYVLNAYRHRYQLLTREAKNLKESIEWMKGLYAGKN